jgi:ABC-2 type transport system ATP-binding protein
VLLSTHILPEVESTCGRVVIIHRGRLVGEGQPGELRGASASGQVLVVEARGQRAQLQQVLAGVQGVREITEVSALQNDPPVWHFKLIADAGDVAEAVFAAVASAGLRLRELRVEKASLEDVFTKLTTHDQAAAGDREQGDVGSEPSVEVGKGAA